MAATPAPTKPHALVLPVPAPGHINPMLRFSFQLALRGFIITFVNTESSHRRMFKAQHLQPLVHADPADPDPIDIRFVKIPDGSANAAGSLPVRPMQAFGETLVDYLKGIENQRGLIRKIIEDSKAELHPISCIIADAFFPWTQDIANKEGIGRIIFWTSNATSLEFFLNYRKTGKSELPDYEGFRVRDFDSQRPDFVNQLNFLARRLDGVEDAVCIAVNSFQELEGFNLQSTLGYNIPIRYIGPVMPFERSDLTISGDLFEEDGDCLEWLSKQKPASVVYVCFGSGVVVTLAQVEELALAIEETKQPFLWVARTNVEGGTVFPKGFIERTRDRGLIVEWAPQVKVLGHPATAAFVTHCGWNSTLESLYMGVPMVCMGMAADQPLNEALIAHRWRAGVATAKEENNFVRKEEVVRALKAVMESKDVRDEARRWKLAARQALMEGGSSNKAFINLIADLQQFKCPPSNHIPALCPL